MPGPHKNACGHLSCGCYVSDCCLLCPLPECLLDNPRQLLETETQRRNMQILHLLDKGFSPPVIARHLEIGLRTVYRVVQSKVVAVTS